MLRSAGRHGCLSVWGNGTRAGPGHDSAPLPTCNSTGQVQSGGRCCTHQRECGQQQCVLHSRHAPGGQQQPVL